MPKQFSWSATAFIRLIAIIAWVALNLQLYISIGNTKTNGLTPLIATWNFFSYFTGLYAYPFINSSELGYSNVLLNAGGIILAFIVTGLLIVGADKSMNRSKNRAFS